MDKLLERCRYDSKPPVREAAVAAIQAMSKMETTFLANHPDSAESGDVSAEQADLNKSMGQREENDDSSELAQSASEPGLVARMPMQSLKSSMNRVHSNKSELSIEALSSKTMRLAASKGPERDADSMGSTWGAQTSARDEGMPTKETWNQLLVHFDRMTQQQTQLIEMVSSFSDSSRDRLESLEQKVYSIELRMSGMEQRQSFGHPAFPPTPARAVRGVLSPLSNSFSWARGKRRGFSPAAAARHSHSVTVGARGGGELSPTSPRAHWIGPEP